MMDQTHIGYTWWQQPPVNKMPEVKTITPMVQASMGVAIEGSETVWPNDSATATLPAINNIQQGSRYIDLFNRGTTPFTYSIKTSSWLHMSATSGQITKEERISLMVEWPAVPVGKHQVPITITGPDNNKVTVFAILEKLDLPGLNNKTLVACGGYISMEADQFNKKIDEKNAHWENIVYIGRTGDGVTLFPPSPRPFSFKPTAAHLEYDLYTTDSGATKVMVYCSPTLPFNESTGLRYAVSFDNETPQIINLHADNSEKAWAQSVSDNIRISTSTYNLPKAGKHTLKIWAVDPGIVLQKIVIDWGGVKQSYLGPPAFKKAIDSGQ
jgi:hypothetical protein